MADKPEWHDHTPETHSRYRVRRTRATPRHHTSSMRRVPRSERQRVADRLCNGIVASQLRLLTTELIRRGTSLRDDKREASIRRLHTINLGLERSEIRLA